jgi:hypothetical protein
LANSLPKPSVDPEMIAILFILIVDELIKLLLIKYGYILCTILIVLKVTRANIDPAKKDIGSTINKLSHYNKIECYYKKLELNNI